MTRNISRPILVAVLVLGLSACGGGGGNGGTQPPPTAPPVGGAPPPPPTATPTLAERFGAAFAAIFGTTASAEPKDPAAGDIVAVNASAEPVDF